jgi:hypothetical protein
MPHSVALLNGAKNRPRRVIDKVEHHLGELYPRIGFIVTKTATQSTRLSCLPDE